MLQRQLTSELDSIESFAYDTMADKNGLERWRFKLAALAVKCLIYIVAYLWDHEATKD